MRVRPGARRLRRPELPALRRVESPDRSDGVAQVIGAEPLLGVVAGGLGAAYVVPYLRDTLRRSTVPHRGSWLIWSVLEVVALVAQHADGARWSLVPLVTEAAGTCLVFGLAVRLGQGGLSRVDLTLIALAGAGVAGWLAVDVPLIAIGCVIAADLMAALMMVPKTWRDPHSETLSTFVVAAVCGVLAAGSVGLLSVPLLVYPVYFALVNAALAAVIVHRRSATAVHVRPIETRQPALVAPVQNT